MVPALLGEATRSMKRREPLVCVGDARRRFAFRRAPKLSPSVTANYVRVVKLTKDGAANDDELAI